MTTPPLSIDATLTEMKERTLSDRPLVVRLTLVFALISALTALTGTGDAFGQAISLGLSLLVGVIYTGMISRLICVPGSERDLAGLWRGITPVLARLVWVTLIVAIGVGVGLLLLIVPGVILFTLWYIAQPVVVAEDAGVFQSLSRSRQLVRGNGWRVFLFILLLLLLVLLASVFAFLVAAPFGTGLLGVVVVSFVLALLVNPPIAIGAAALYNCLSGGSLADHAIMDSPDPVEELPADPAEPDRD